MSSNRTDLPTKIARMVLDGNLASAPEFLNEDELIDRLLDAAIATLEQIAATVEEVNQKLASLEQRIESGQIRREVQAATLQCCPRDGARSQSF